jgi:hypothetical protein
MARGRADAAVAGGAPPLPLLLQANERRRRAASLPGRRSQGRRRHPSAMPLLRATAHLPPGGAERRISLPVTRRATDPSSLPPGMRARSLVGPRGALSIPRDLEEAEASGRMAGAFPSPAADVVPGKVSGKRMARGMEETGVAGLTTEGHEIVVPTSGGGIGHQASLGRFLRQRVPEVLCTLQHLRVTQPLPAVAGRRSPHR